MAKTTTGAAAPSPDGNSKSKSKKAKPVTDVDELVSEITDEIMTEKSPVKLPPPSAGPLQVYTPSGKLVQSSAPTVVQCLMELSKKVKEVTCITVPLNKGDCAEFQANYQNNRETSKANVAKLVRRFNTQDYIRDYPSLAFDADGAPFNGGHTTEALIASNVESWPFVTLLGVDAKMGPREDTNKIRDLIDQCYYLDNDVYGEQIAVYKSLKKHQQRTYTASTAYIFSMQVATGLLTIDLQPSEAKKEVVQHPLGQKLLRMCLQPYLDASGMLEKLAKAEEREEDGNVYTSFQRVAFLVPALIFRMSGYKDYPKQIMVPEKASGPLYKAHEYLWRRSDEEAAGPEMTTRREQIEILHVIATVLAYAYCAANPDAKLRLPKPRWEKVKVLKEGKRKTDPKVLAAIKKSEGDMAYIWETYTRKEKDEDAAIRKEIATFFLSKIKIS